MHVLLSCCPVLVTPWSLTKTQRGCGATENAAYLMDATRSPDMAASWGPQLDHP